jgi:hypothetical protein
VGDAVANDDLGNARKAKDDEFYTQYSDIEKEMNAYLDFNEDVFHGKTVLLPCDDPEWSNFTKYFAQNFERLGLKKLISTSYAPNSKPKEIPYYPPLFELESDDYDSEKTQANGKIFVVVRDVNLDNKINVEDIEWSYLEGDGDFRSEEVSALRDEADIIVTNPPFSLFREFLSWLVQGKKDFVILGNMNAITYKETFQLIKANSLWLGATIHSGDREFRIPADSVTRSPSRRTDEDGNVYLRVPGIRWFTNLDHGRRHEPLSLMSEQDNIKFSRHKEVKGLGYRKYDNYEAIEVPFTDAIPSDFSGVMGVPISFLSKYNPEQFEIVGTLAQSDPNYPFRTKWYSPKDQQDAYFRRFGKEGSIPLNMSGVIDDVKVYQRILIRHRKAAQ